MPYPITIPRLGWSMEEGTFCQWLRASGEFIRAGDILFLLEGEKAAQEIEALDSGYLCIPTDAPPPGASVKVGDVLGYLLTEGEAAPTSVRTQAAAAISSPQPEPQPLPRAVPSEPSKSAVPLSPTLSRAVGPAARRLARKLGIDPSKVFTPDPTGRVLSEDLRQAVQPASLIQSSQATATDRVATPRARRRARELGIDWTRLRGTGRGGRIREQDVIASVKSGTESEALSVSELCPTEPGRYQAASKLRQIIAQRMVAGAHQAVPVTLTTKVNAEALVAFREQQKIQAGGGSCPSINDILIHWVAHLLPQLPELNACWVRQGVFFYDDIHIATAVDTPSGLLAPVIRHADRLTLTELADCSRKLIDGARSGTLSQSQLVGGTFTVTNLGMFGIDSFTPVLNLPQAAILGIGRIIEEPVVRSGRLEIGQTLTLSLTFDHRVIDGGPVARWLQCLSTRIASTAS